MSLVQRVYLSIFLLAIIRTPISGSWQPKRSRRWQCDGAPTVTTALELLGLEAEDPLASSHSRHRSPCSTKGPAVIAQLGALRPELTARARRAVISQRRLAFGHIAANVVRRAEFAAANLDRALAVLRARSRNFPKIMSTSRRVRA